MYWFQLENLLVSRLKWRAWIDLCLQFEIVRPAISNNERNSKNWFCIIFSSNVRLSFPRQIFPRSPIVILGCQINSFVFSSFIWINTQNIFTIVLYDFCSSVLPVQLLPVVSLLTDLLKLLITNRIKINGKKRTKLSDNPIDLNVARWTMVNFYRFYLVRLLDTRFCFKSWIQINL